MNDSSAADDANQDCEPAKIRLDHEFDAVLNGWHTATLRLEKTHDALQTEVRRLAREVNEKNRELAGKTRLSELGRMSSHIAHELRGNLTPISLCLSLLRHRVAGDRDSLEIMDKIDSSMLKLDSTVSDLLSFITDRDPRLQPIRVRGLVEEICGALSAKLSSQSVGVSSQVPDDLSVVADGEMLRRAILNLSLNALDAMPNGGRLFVSACGGEAYVDLEVGDTGPGLSDEVRRRAFEPFFTTKSRGAGLGLAIVDRVARSHGGEVFAVNGPEGGAAFTIRLPTRSLGSQKLAEAA